MKEVRINTIFSYIFINNQSGICIMHDKSSEKKLVEAFKTFFQKSITPYVYNNETIMNEWKYFNKLISSQPIDYSQIEFYILLANKSQPNYPQNSMPTDYRASGVSSDQSRFIQGTPSQKSIIEGNNSDKKANAKSYMTTTKKETNSNISSNSRRNLINSLESFQSLLVKNQEKLESFNRKDVTNQTAGSNTLKRYH